MKADAFGPRNLRVVAVVAITLAGLALRLPSLRDSLFGDELSAYYVVAGHSLGQVMHLLNGHSTELNPPLFFVLAWLSERLFGASAESLKLVSLLAGTATIPLTYALGRRTVGERAALVGCALVALCPFLIFYSTEARPYALMVLLVLLSTLALLRALRDGQIGAWGIYALLACLAAYTHFATVFPLAAQFVWALATHPAARRALIAASVAAAVLYVPWLPVLIKTSQSPGTKLYAFLEPFTLSSARVDLGRWAIGHPYVSLSSVPGSVVALIALIALLAAVIGMLLRVLGDPAAKPRLVPSSGAVLVVVLACAAPIGVALYSALRESIWFARNLLSSSPAFGLLLGTLVTSLGAGWRLVTEGLLVAAFAIGAISMIPAANHRPDYQEAIAYIGRVAPGYAPIADLVGPTPGPPSETDAALALAGTTRRHPVFRIGVAPLSQVLAATPYAPLSAQRGENVAHMAATAAGHGLLFILAPTSVSLAHVQARRRQHIHSNASVLDIFSTFLGALPTRFQPVTAKTFAGFVPVTVYVYRSH